MRRRDLLECGIACTDEVSLAVLINACTSSTEPAADSNDTEVAAGDSEPSVLTVVQGGGFPNRLDLHQVGVNRSAYGI